MRLKYTDEIIGKATASLRSKKEEPFNIWDNLKPFTWKKYLDKGIWLHLFSKRTIVWTEMKVYMSIILCHDAEEVKATTYSLYCLLFIPITC